MSAIAEKLDLYPSGFPKEVKRTKHDLILNKQLKKARNKRGYSLDKVATLLMEKKGIKTSKTTIQGYEAEENNMNHRYPSLFMLMALIDIYDCSADFLFDKHDEIERPSHDFHYELTKVEKVNWMGKTLTPAQKSMIIEKVNEIIAL